MVSIIMITVYLPGIDLPIPVVFKRIRDTEFWEAFRGTEPHGIFHEGFINLKLATEIANR